MIDWKTLFGRAHPCNVASCPVVTGQAKKEDADHCESSCQLKEKLCPGATP